MVLVGLITPPLGVRIPPPQQEMFTLFFLIPLLTGINFFAWFFLSHPLSEPFTLGVLTAVLFVGVAIIPISVLLFYINKTEKSFGTRASLASIVTSTSIASFFVFVGVQLGHENRNAGSYLFFFGWFPFALFMGILTYQACRSVLFTNETKSRIIIPLIVIFASSLVAQTAHWYALSKITEINAKPTEWVPFSIQSPKGTTLELDLPKKWTNKVGTSTIETSNSRELRRYTCWIENHCSSKTQSTSVYISFPDTSHESLVRNEYTKKRNEETERGGHKGVLTSEILYAEGPTTHIYTRTFILPVSNGELLLVSTAGGVNASILTTEIIRHLKIK